MQIVKQLLYVLANCGFDDAATSEEKIISSPNWPQNYTNFERCSWNLTTSDEYKIEIFFQHFDLERKYDILVSKLLIRVLLFYFHLKQVISTLYPDQHKLTSPF